MLPLGTELPSFKLTDVRTGEVVGADDFAGNPLLVIFLCVHCPYVKRIQEGLARLGRDYAGTSLGIVGIASNDASTYPEDAPESQAKVADDVGYAFPVLYDETQEVARAFTAACTPDFFMFNGDHRLVYRGQFDGARPSNNVPVTGESVRAAIQALLDGKTVGSDQMPSMGCSIKWKAEASGLRIGRV
ncbi:MAG: thioredoxin family protein [Acidimicrobiia bacterium]